MKDINNFIYEAQATEMTTAQLEQIKADMNVALKNTAPGNMLRDGIDCNFGGIQLDPGVAKQFAGYVCEVVVKSLLKDALQNNEIKNNWQIDYTQQPEEKWYDYQVKELGALVEIKACLNGKRSNIKLTQAQSKNVSKLIFIIANYSINGSTLFIDSIDIVEGKNVMLTGKNNDRIKF